MLQYVYVNDFSFHLLFGRCLVLCMIKMFRGGGGGRGGGWGGGSSEGCLKWDGGGGGH